MDRFFCVFFPIKYIKAPVTFCYLIAVLPYFLDIPTYVIAFLGAQADNGNYTVQYSLYSAWTLFYRQI